jgi:hypothetical protein
MLSHEFEDFPLPCWIPTGSKMYVMSTPDQETLAAENFARTMHFQVSKIVQTEAHQTQNLLLIWTWLKLPKLFISIMIDNDPKKKGRIQISRLNPAISRNWIWPPCLWHNGINHSKTKKTSKTSEIPVVLGGRHDRTMFFISISTWWTDGFPPS